MDRREFLKLSASAGISGIGISLPGAVNLLTQDARAEAKPDLAVVRGSSPSKITEAAVNALGGMKTFISRGDIVVIKPNIGWDRTPDQAANTNPEVVATIVRLCIDAGAKKVTVFDRPVNDPRRCYVQSGIANAAREAGAEVPFTDEKKFRDMTIKGNFLKSWPLYTDVFEADKVINIPIAKHHGLAGLTMSIKNWMGIMGGKRSRIHQNLDEALPEVAMTVKPALTILDAVRILTGNGPQGGSFDDVKKLDTVIAGIDQVAIDSYGATLFGKKGSDLGYVSTAHKNGLGTMDLAKLNIREIKIH